MIVTRWRGGSGERCAFRLLSAISGRRIVPALEDCDGIKLASRLRPFAATIGGIRHPLQARLSLGLPVVALEGQLLKVRDCFRNVGLFDLSPTMLASRTIRVFLNCLVGRFTAAGSKRRKVRPLQRRHLDFV
ncbi:MULTISPECIES: hypothetical protein [unclassified Bradyrhizobium]|uniref:hypothetical protein n=1 Tax=unclassified Bradyrhizobium TaxID=2631580 RepID=UPI0012E33025|nr:MULTISPECIES: hypothetical protein [unclassified Bradyrhizobium]